MNLYKLIQEGEFKIDALPDEYFVDYFEEEFLPKLKEIYKKLQQKCNIQADSLHEAEFINEIKRII